MDETVREVIKSTIKTHLLDKKGKVYGQCLTAVGWVGGTLPELYEDDGMVELPMADVAGGGFVVGASLAGDRPIYVVRYQGFQWYNCISVVNYAAKSKEIWRRPCPIFVRSIAMEGGVGPVAGSSHHSLVYRMPGIKIASPMTPKEYKTVYDEFMNDDLPYYVSEHRKSYDNSIELEDMVNHSNPDFTIVAISVTRFEMKKLQEICNSNNIKVNIFNLLWIKPLKIDEQCIESLKNTKYTGLVLDDDYESGCQSSISNYLSIASNKIIYNLGLKDKSAGFHNKVDNMPPTALEIFEKIISIKNTYKD